MWLLLWSLLVIIIQGLTGARFKSGIGESKAKNNVCFFFAFGVVWALQVFNRCPMYDSRLAVASCIEHERLAFELLEVRTRGQYLTRLRSVNDRERQASGTAGSAPHWRDWWITSWSMVAAVDGLGSAEGKLRVALLRYELVICGHYNVSGGCGGVPAPAWQGALSGPFAKFLISSTEV